MSERTAMITLLIENAVFQLDGKGMKKGGIGQVQDIYAGVASGRIKQFLSSPFSMPRHAFAKGGAVCKGRNTRQAAIFRLLRIS